MQDFMDVSAMAVWMTVFSTLLRDCELGTTTRMQYVHDLLSYLYGLGCGIVSRISVYSKADHAHH